MNPEKLSTLALQTARLTISPFTAADANGLFALVSDAETCADDGGYRPFAAWDGAFDALVARFAADTGRYAIRLTSTGETIGVLHLMPSKNRAVPCISIGYVISKDHRRKGYAFEAVSAVVKACYEVLDAEMLEATTFPWNEGSMHLLEKLGFQREGITHNAQRHCERGIVDIVNFYHIPQG